MQSSNEAYRCHLLKHLPTLARQSSVGQRLRFCMSHVLALVLVDLEPARPLLLECYSGRRGGRVPRDPVSMLRSLLLMLMTGCTDPNQWVARLRGEPELAVLSGFAPERPPPGVGTFYDFFHRLLDGPYQRPCEHQSKPSERVRGRSFLRQLKQEKAAVEAATQAEQARKQQGRVEHLVDKALSARDQPVPQDLSQRLNEILMRCAVVPSANEGLLGNLEQLVVAGDGTAIDSHASGWGQRDCDCPAEAKCECPRRYSDPEATWGYDSARERYYFGYRLQVLSTRGVGDDLPLQVSLQGAHTPDVVLGVEGMSRLMKRLAEPDVAAQVFAALFDKGYDATAFYRLLQQEGICPLIPLSQEVKTPTCQQGIERDAQGRPLCVGGLAMRLHQRDAKQGELLYNCPVKRPGREQGKLVFKARVEECPRKVLCEPDSVMGPILHIRLKGDPRMNLAIPRGSALFAQLYKDRTATERYNSTLKSKGAMARGAYRRKHIVLTMAVLHAVELHADTWVRRAFSQGGPRTAEELLTWLAQAEQADRTGEQAA